jgi:prepilin-type N-terminal cleavage/methylation domain-containing protein
MNARLHARGFTLLELIAAIAMVALITGSLYSALYVGFKAQRSTTEAVIPARKSALLSELLAQDISGAVNPTGIMAGLFLGSRGTGVNGSDALSFYSSANVPALNESGSDLRHVEISVETLLDDNRPALVRRVTTNLLPSAGSFPREQILARNINSFTLRYYDGTQWLDSWDSTAQGDLLPLAIEALIEFNLNETDNAFATNIYRLRRVFEVPCGRTAAQATTEAAP